MNKESESSSADTRLDTKGQTEYAEETQRELKLETRRFRTLCPEALLAVVKCCPAEAKRVIREIVHRLGDCGITQRKFDDTTKEHMLSVVEEEALYSTLGKAVFAYWSGLTAHERLVIGNNAMTGAERRSLLDILVQFSTADFDDEVGDPEADRG